MQIVTIVSTYLGTYLGKTNSPTPPASAQSKQQDCGLYQEDGTSECCCWHPFNNFARIKADPVLGTGGADI